SRPTATWRSRPRSSIGWSPASPSAFPATASRAAPRSPRRRTTRALRRRGRSIRGKVDIVGMVRDVRAALEALKAEGLPVGVVGYCLGGTLAWLACTRVDGVKAAVGYYRGGHAGAPGGTP